MLPCLEKQSRASFATLQQSDTISKSVQIKSPQIFDMPFKFYVERIKLRELSLNRGPLAGMTRAPCSLLWGTFNVRYVTWACLRSDARIKYLQNQPSRSKISLKEAKSSLKYTFDFGLLRRLVFEF